MASHRIAVLGFALAAALAIPTGARLAPSPGDTRNADEATIRKADEDWAKAAKAGSVPGWTTFYADDAVVLPAGGPIANTKDTIAKSVRDNLGAMLDIDWKPTRVEVAASGDLAYSYGAYSATVKDISGKAVSDTGKYVEVWRKQADGGWKCIIDTWNSDLP